MQARRHQQLARLALMLLVTGVTAGASAQSPRDGVIPIFTFHGPVTSSSEAEQAEVLLHVLLKTKRKPDGAFIVRTVSYAETYELQGNERSSGRASKHHGPCFHDTAHTVLSGLAMWTVWRSPLELIRLRDVCFCSLCVTMLSGKVCSLQNALLQSKSETLIRTLVSCQLSKVTHSSRSSVCKICAFVHRPAQALIALLVTTCFGCLCRRATLRTYSRSADHCFGAL